MNFYTLCYMYIRNTYRIIQKNEAELYVLIWKDIQDKSLKGKKQAEEQSRE